MRSQTLTDGGAGNCVHHLRSFTHCGHDAMPKYQAACQSHSASKRPWSEEAQACPGLPWTVPALAPGLLAAALVLCLLCSITKDSFHSHLPKTAQLTMPPSLCRNALQLTDSLCRVLVWP